MEPGLTHEETLELLGAFALDAVEPAEAEAISAHLARCPRCRDEVASLREVAAMLGNTGGEAPAGIWDAIASRIERPASALGDRPAPRLASLEEARRRRGIGNRVALKLGSVAAAVAVVAVAVLGAEVWKLDQRLGHVAATSRSASLAGAAKNALLDPSAQRIILDSTEGHSLAPAAEIVVEPSGEAFFFNRSMAPLPRDKTYQLWAVRNGQAVSLGILGGHPRTVVLSFQLGGGGYTLAMTVEPAGGSPAPTGAPVAASV